MTQSLRDLEVSRAYPARMIRLRHGTERLVLRPTLTSDAEVICAAVLTSLKELGGFMPWAHFPQTARSQLDRLKQVEADYFGGRDLAMALFRESDGALLAGVGLHARTLLNPRALEVGYWAPTAHTGNGFVTLAVRAVTIYAFDKLGADRVQVMCDQANVRSRRVIERCGFVEEGVLRNATEAPPLELVAKGYRATGNCPMFSLVPEEFAALPWVSELRSQLVYVNLGGYENLSEVELSRPNASPSLALQVGA